MMLTEENFWTAPTFHGLYDDNDYSGKEHIFATKFFFLNTFLSVNISKYIILSRPNSVLIKIGAKNMFGCSSSKKI